MPSAFVGPIGPFPSERQTTAKPPSNHSQVSRLVIFPPGMKGLGFMSASADHLPTKYPSFLYSGPGFGFSAGVSASASPDDSARQTARLRSLVLMSHLREWAGILASFQVVERQHANLERPAQVQRRDEVSDPRGDDRPHEPDPMTRRPGREAGQNGRQHRAQRPKHERQKGVTAKIPERLGGHDRQDREERAGDQQLMTPRGTVLLQDRDDGQK